MPVVKVSMLEGRTPEVKQKIAKDITDSLVRNLGNKPHHIYVVFEDVPATDWAAGGVLLSEYAEKPKKE